MRFSLGMTVPGNWDEYGVNLDNNTPYNSDGFDINGKYMGEFASDPDGWDCLGWNVDTSILTRKNGDLYDVNGWDVNGWNIDNIFIYTSSVYNNLGYNKSGYSSSGYDISGFNSAGLNLNGLNLTGFNAAGWTKYGKNVNGTYYDASGYNVDGYNISGYNGAGYNTNGYNSSGFNAAGWNDYEMNINGTMYAASGYNNSGYNAAGFNAAGWSPNYGKNVNGTFYLNGYTINGYDSSGFNAAGWTIYGMNRNETFYDASGFNIAGWNIDNNNVNTNTAYDASGFDINGFDMNGCNTSGWNPNTHVNVNGTSYDASGYDIYGINSAGFNTQGWSPITGNYSTGTPYNASGYNLENNDSAGFNIYGWNLSTNMNINGSLYDINGYDIAGNNSDGFNIYGWNPSTNMNINGTLYDNAGYDIAGNNSDGFNTQGWNYTTDMNINGTLYGSDGFNIGGLNSDGFSRAGWNTITSMNINGTPYGPDGFNIDGFNSAGFGIDGWNLTTGLFVNGTIYGADGYGLATFNIYNYNKQGVRRHSKPLTVHIVGLNNSITVSGFGNLPQYIIRLSNGQEHELLLIDGVDNTWTFTEQPFYVPITATVTCVGGGLVQSLPSDPSNSVTLIPVPPSKPLGVSIVGFENTITVTWNQPSNEGTSPVTQYTITLSTGATFTKTNEGTNSKVFLNQPIGVATTATVVAVSSDGNSPSSDTSNSVTLSSLDAITIPGEPESISGTAAPTSATINWSPPLSNGNSAITGYKVLCVPDNKKPNLAGPNDRSMTITGLKNATIYNFMVLAINAIGMSDTLTATPYPLPNKPTVIAVNTPGAVNVSWLTKPIVGSPVTGYIVTTSPVTEGTVIQEPTLTLTGGSTQITGLTSGTPYIISVSSVSAMGASIPSPAKSIIAAITPSAPLAVQAIRALASASLSWTTPASNGGLPIIGYKISYTDAGVAKLVNVKVVNATIIKGLANATEYTFKVQAVTAIGSSVESEPVTMIAAIAPSPPLAVQGIRALASAGVSWSNPESNGGLPITGYAISYTLAGVLKVVNVKLVNSTIIKGLVNGTPYIFTVNAVNVMGSSLESDSVTVTPGN